MRSAAPLPEIAMEEAEAYSLDDELELIRAMFSEDEVTIRGDDCNTGG